MKNQVSSFLEIRWSVFLSVVKMSTRWKLLMFNDLTLQIQF